MSLSQVRKIAVFSARTYDRTHFTPTFADSGIELVFFDSLLDESTMKLAEGSDAVCVFVNDDANAKVLQYLSSLGQKVIFTRSAGFNQIDVLAARSLGMSILRVPAYSPYAPAEHALALIMSLNRKVHKAYNRTREQNFEIDGLDGFDMKNAVFGVVGTGKIGAILCRILASGFGAKVVAFDKYENEEVKKMGVQYVSLDELLRSSDVISLHAPLTKETEHMINADAIAKCKKGVMIVNTGRGALIDTRALVDGLKSKKIGACGLDVYEYEKKVFFRDLSRPGGEGMEDDLLSRLLTFPNVIVTGHMAFFTKEALEAIAQTTLKNVKDFNGRKNDTDKLPNEVRQEDMYM